MPWRRLLTFYFSQLSWWVWHSEIVQNNFCDALSKYGYLRVLRKIFKVIKFLRGQTAEQDQNGFKIWCSETGLGVASRPSCSEKRMGENPCEFDISNFHTAWVIVCDPLLRQKQSRNKSGLANLNVDFFCLETYNPIIIWKFLPSVAKTSQFFLILTVSVFPRMTIGSCPCSAKILWLVSWISAETRKKWRPSWTGTQRLASPGTSAVQISAD